MRNSIIILFAIIFILLVATQGSAVRLKDLLRESVAYLEDIPQVKWIRVEKNNVIIGWKGIPRKFNRTNREAGVKGAKATGRKVHVWSVRHNQKNWVLGTRPYICTTTVDKGIILNSTCK